MDISISLETASHKPYNLMQKILFNQGFQNTTKDFSVVVRYNKIVSLK